MTMSTHPTEKVLAAPEELGLDSRTAFRRAAGELLAQLEEGTGRLVIDLSGTRQVDSAGLGALMLIQRKAAERRLAVCLRGANEELRFLFVFPKLERLFGPENGAAHPALPVIVATSYVSMDPLINVLDLGHSGYLVKPFDMEDLAARIDALG